MQTTKRLFPNLLTTAALCGFSMSVADAATLDGFISDEKTGTALEGAVVRVLDLDLETSSNRRGYFEFDGLEPGTYVVQVSYVGAEAKSLEAQVTDAGPSMLDVEMKPSVYELTDFTVSAYQTASTRAANLQRSSENLRDIIASDYFGQFADTNAAEALNRLPGVSVERDQGEGRFVIIRGIDPNLNSVAIDGITLAAPSDSERSTLLDTIPIEILDTLEVTKAVLPDQPGDSIGGHINLRSPSAFDGEGRVSKITAAYLYSDLVDEDGYRFNGAYADTFGDEGEFGLYLTVVNSERTFGSDNVEADPWEAEGGSYVTPEIQYREYDLTRERTGVSANFEYQPNSDSLFFVRTSYNNYKDTEIRDRSNTKFEGDYSNVTASSFDNDEIESEIELKEREENMRIWVASIGGEQSAGDWEVDYTLAFSQAEEDTPFDYEAVYVNDSTYAGTVSRAGGKPLVESDPSITDASTYEFDEITFGEQLVEETDLSAIANFKREFDHEKLEYIKFGGLLRMKEKESDFDESEADDDTGVETADLFLATDARNPFGRPIPSLNTGIFGFARTNLPTAELAYESQIEDYESEENVFAAYLMASFDLGEWKLIGGARVEHTEFETDGFEGDDDNEIITGTTSFDKDYTNFLPGLHLRREFSDELIFRASWTNTIARPTFGQSNPAELRDGNDVERGNPDLDPYEAMNLDASLQFYSQDYGTFGVAVFYKDIEDFIYEQTFDEGADEVTSFENGEEGDILGLELSYSRQLDFLPGALAGLSINTNLTFTDSEADAQRPGGGAVESLQFIKQSDLIGSISLAWEWDRYFVRLSGSYRDEYLDEIGEEAFEDRYVEDFFQVDFYSSVRIADNVSAFLELNNLTDEPFEARFGESGRLSQFEEYGVSGAFGIKASF